jgi:hypothetical protein
MTIHFAMLGTFCLGAFIGTVVSVGLHLATNANNFGKVVTTILSSIFGAGVLQFLGKAPEFGTSLGLAGYCGGLLVAISWAYMGEAKKNIKENFGLKWLGILHIAGAVFVSLIGAFLFILPAILDWRLLLRVSSQ